MTNSPERIVVDFFKGPSTFRVIAIPTSITDQVLPQLAVFQPCVIHCTAEKKMKDLKSEMNAFLDRKYFILLDVTDLPDFVLRASILADRYACLGKKLLLVGDIDKIKEAADDSLFDRVVILDF